MHNYSRQVSQALDHEHRASLEHFERVERALVGGGNESEWPALAAALARQLEHEIGRHFDFEEKDLFPRMAEAGDADMVGLLLEEHHSIREVAGELLPLARAMAKNALPAGERATFKRLGLEMVERMVSHIQKESMSLLPTLEDLLDEDTDRELAFAYAAG